MSADGEEAQRLHQEHSSDTKGENEKPQRIARKTRAGLGENSVLDAK